MKKLTVLFLSILFSVTSLLNVYAADNHQRVFDEAGLFSKSEIESLEEKLYEAVDEMKMDFVVLTTDDKHGLNMEEYADDFYDNGDFGTGKERSGILFMIDMEERSPYISTTGKMIEYMTDDRINSIVEDDDKLFGYLGDGKYADAAEHAIKRVVKYYGEGIEEGQYTYDRETGKIVRRKSLGIVEVLISLFASLGIAFNSINSIKNQYSMKREKKASLGFRMAYRDSCNYAFTTMTDRLISHNVTRRFIPKTTTSSDGGSTAGRSTIHTGSSGTSHGGGGGGRKF